MDLENVDGRVVIFIRETISKTKDKDMEKCIGLMDLIIWDNGMMEYRMEMGNYTQNLV